MGAIGPRGPDATTPTKAILEKMKKFMILVCAAACALPLCAAAADVSVTADVLSAYDWRGQVINDEPVLQPSIDIAAPLGFGFNLWGNMDLTDNYAENGACKWSEWDFEANWTVPMGEDAPVDVTFAGVYYVYPQDENADGDYDLYAKVKGNCLLAPSVRAVHSLHHPSDWRLEFGIGHDFSLLDALTLGLGAKVCYAFDDWMERQYGCDAGFNDVELKANLDFAVTDAWSVGALVGYTSLLDGDVRDAVDEADGHKDYVYGGVTTTYSF